MQMNISFDTLPPAIQQALMSRLGIRSDEDIAAAAQRLKDNPAELASILQSLGVNVNAAQAQQLAVGAEQWINQAAAKQASGGKTDDRAPQSQEEAEEGDTQQDTPQEEQQEQEQTDTTTERGGGDYGSEDGDAPAQSLPDARGSAEAAPIPTPSSPDYGDRATADTEPDDSGAAGDPRQAFAKSQQPASAYSSEGAGADSGDGERAMAAPAGGRAMPRGAGRSASRGGPAQQAVMDDAITAMMARNMQAAQAAGAQAPGGASAVAQVPGGRPQMPHSPAAVASQDPRMRQMIANIYRSEANRSSGPERAVAPPGGAPSGNLPKAPRTTRNR